MLRWENYVKGAARLNLFPSPDYKKELEEISEQALKEQRIGLEVIFASLLLSLVVMVLSAIFDYRSTIYLGLGLYAVFLTAPHILLRVINAKKNKRNL